MRRNRTWIVVGAAVGLFWATGALYATCGAGIIEKHAYGPTKTGCPGHLFDYSKGSISLRSSWVFQVFDSSGTFYGYPSHAGLSATGECGAFPASADKEGGGLKWFLGWTVLEQHMDCNPIIPEPTISPGSVSVSVSDTATSKTFGLGSGDLKGECYDAGSDSFGPVYPTCTSGRIMNSGPLFALTDILKPQAVIWPSPSEIHPFSYRLMLSSMLPANGVSRQLISGVLQP